jgi:hypothetical protein
VTKWLPANLVYAFSRRNGITFSAAALFMTKRLPANPVYVVSRRKRMKFPQNNIFRDETASKKLDLQAFFAKKTGFFSQQCFSWRKKLKNS